MKLAKLDCPVISEALKDKELFGLRCYLSDFKRTPEGYFISQIVNCCGEQALDFKLALEDYFFNEYQEYEKVWDLAEKLTGKKDIKWKIIKIVEL